MDLSFSYLCELIYSETSTTDADISQIFISGIVLSSEFQNPLVCPLDVLKPPGNSTYLKMNEWDSDSQLSKQEIFFTLDSLYPHYQNKDKVLTGLSL